MKLKFEEAIAVPDSQRRSVADSIDYHSIGIIYLFFQFFFFFWSYFSLSPFCT